MGLKVDPDQIVAQADSLVHNYNEYYTMANRLRSSMNYVINNCTAEGKAIAAVKNQAEAHIVALDYFELIATEASRDRTSLKNAVADNDISVVLDEDTLTTLVQNYENSYNYYCDRISAVQSFDFTLDDIVSHFLSLVVDYERARDNALELKQKYETMLQNLRNFEAQTSGLFQSLSTHIQQQNALLNELMRAGTEGKFPSSSISLLETMRSECKNNMASPEEILFIRDKNGKIRINDEALALFSDVEEDDMTHFQKSLRDRVAEYALSDACTTDDLNAIVKAFYGTKEDRVVADGHITLTPLKNNAKGFASVLDNNLNAIIKEGKATEDQVSRAALFSSLFAKGDICKFDSIKNENGTYKVSYTGYRLVYGMGGYDSGKWKTSMEPQNYNDEYEIYTYGHGDSGNYFFLKDQYDKMCKELGKDSSQFLGRSTYAILLENALKNAPGAGTAIVIGTDFVDSLDKNYQSRIAVQNGITADNAITTDCYVTMVGERLVSRHGPNTDMILEYLKRNGYTLDGTQLENAKKINSFGQSINLTSPIDICNYFQTNIGKEKWVH